MTSIDAPETLLTEWSRVIAAALVEQGVREVIVSPGSRSTPFVLALGARAELRCIDVVDERCASFVALGMARASGRPVALLCTSGTAPAHWYPAVIEASLTSVPLVLLTADRPAELAACGAPQTIDQLKMFGDHVRHFADVGAPDASEGALRGLRRAIAQAVAASAHGPVHLNLRARKPLEPREPKDDASWALRRRVDAILAAPATRVAAVRSESDPIVIDEIARALDAAERPLIVVGPMAATSVTDGSREAIVAIARATGAPVFAEASSQVRFAGRARQRLVALDALDLVIRSIAREDEPDLVVQLGATTTSSAFDAFVAARPLLTRIVIADRWTDPHGTAATMVLGALASTLPALARAVGRTTSRLDHAWRDRLIAADRRAWTIVDHDLEVSEGLSEGAVARTLVAALPDRALLTVGNSLPIRTLDRYVHGGDDLVVLSQRGANGIDGLASGAIGASLATGAVSAVLLGDLSMQHDLGALATASQVTSPLAIVVVQNSGGRIFEQLPIAGVAGDAIERFTTPQSLRFDLAAAAFGVSYTRATDPQTLRAALDAALGRAGTTLIEAVVPPHGARDAERRIVTTARGGS